MPVDITEYSHLARDASGNIIPAGKEPSRAVQQITATGTSQQSSAFDSATTLVRIHTDANVRIAFGPNPTAAATTQRVPSGGTEFFGVKAGDKVAVITST